MAKYILVLVVMFASSAFAENFVNVCERSEAVKNIIEVSTKKRCKHITPEDLLHVEYMNLSQDSNYRAQSLKQGDFQGLENLVRIELFYAFPIKELPPHIFDGLKNLKILDLKRVELESFPSTLTKDLVSLESLDISANEKIRNLEPGIFDTNTHLKSLDLSGIGLEKIPDHIFDRLPDLEEIVLSRNPFDSVPHDLFKSQRRFRVFNLSGTNLKALSADFFSSINFIYFLEMKYNSLETLPPGVFRTLSSVQFIDLSGNRFTNLPTGVFNDLHVSQLSLQDCHIRIISDRAAKDLAIGVNPAGASIQLSGNALSRENEASVATALPKNAHVYF